MKINLKNNKLAINGGKPIRKKVWLNNITTGNSELKNVKKVLNSGNLSLFEGSYKPETPFSFNGGPYVNKLENNWSKYYNVSYSISLNSATSCLFSSIGALGIGYGDEVIVSPYTMTACALAPLIYGAIPIFADVEEDTGCIDPVSFQKKITKRTKAIIIVHQFGFPANMKKIMKIAKKNKVKVIEDCAQAHGAKYRGKLVGTFGDIGIFSLNVNKSIQSGEGGICITNNKNTAYRLKLIRNHGEAVVGPAKYKDITNIAGFNYRMTELTASIAIEQLKKLNTLNVIRINLVNQLTKNMPVMDFFKAKLNRKECMNCDCKKRCLNTFYLLTFSFDKNKINLSRNKFVKLLNKEGGKFYEAYTKPLYYQPLYQKKRLFKKGYPFKAIENKNIKTNYEKNSCPVSEKLYKDSLILNEYIRFPHTKRDINDLVKIFWKLTT